MADYPLSLYFGLPGCGKSTYATMFAVEEQKRIEKGRSIYKAVYTNFPVFYKGVYQISALDLGKKNIRDSLIIIDEASLIADSRDYKKFSPEMKEFFLLHRHFRCEIILFTQQWDAVDKKIRVITNKVYYVHKGSFRRWLSYATPIELGIIIPDKKKDDTEKLGEIIQGYYKGSFMSRLCSRRIKRKRYYKYFDTYFAPQYETDMSNTEWISLLSTE